ncbi:hypothetical protein BC937DRAFT_95662 [Endogone sp. FLAS-F59071]|nr:hypothetical protein BC937DRAFT_95662 [Endogone sp. FLAS-F59071]|eukprot:RUS13214.1 hypothetical protein BC937DRAFT_95662 [Endogone sp. FLAS-F59071]
MVEVPHAQFVIQTKIDNKEAVYVARRYGQFRALYQELKHNHPTIEIPQVPPKAQNIFNRIRPTEHHLYRERDRLSLRSFLHRLAAEPHLARSEAFIKFLTTDSFKLNHEESYNAERRAEMDNIRADQERAFREQVDRRVEELNVQLDGLKKELMKPAIRNDQDHRQRVRFAHLSSEGNGLGPDQFDRPRSFAFVLHTHFLTSDDAAQNFATLKRTNALVPYRTLRTVLRLSNPIAMVRGVLDVFLAQPFGASSLFQR